MTTMRARTFSITLALLVGAYVLPAGATGFSVARFGGEHGDATATNPTAIYYNPAGLAGGKGTRAYIEGLFALRLVTYNRDPGAIDAQGLNPNNPDDAAYIAANSGEGSLSNIVASPFVGVVSDFGIENLGVGLAFYVPYGGQAKYDKNDAFDGDQRFPGAVDGTQRWGTIEGTIRASFISVGAGYKFPFGLSVGLAGNVILHNINTVRAYNSDGTDTLEIDGVLQEGRALVDVKGTTFSIGVGVMYTPEALPNLTIGLSYQTQPGFKELTLTGTTSIKLGATDTMVFDTDFETALPDVVKLGVAYRPMPTLELRLWGTLERWNHLESQCVIDAGVDGRKCIQDGRGQSTSESVGVISNVPRNWNDGINVRASGSYWLNPDLELMFGLGYDGNVVPDETMDSSLPDWHDFVINAGARFALMEGRLMLSATLSQYIYLARTVDPQPRTSGERMIYQRPSRVPDGAGKYTSSVSVLTLGVGYNF